MIFKISIILLLLIVTVGSVYAADNADSTLSDNPDDDFELNEDLDDDGSEDNENDDSEEDDGEDDESEDDEDDEDDDEDDDWEDDESEDDEDDEDDDEDDDWEDDESEDDEDEDWEDDDVNDFDFLEFKILMYLEKYGNCTDENWTESEDFLNEYQIYLNDPSNYTLNESAEGYKTYLKIYDSITSTFGDYNLTENETAYLKFLVIYYLNHYGNVSANYTWNESDDFANFTPKDLLGAYYFGCASSKGAAGDGINDFFPHLDNLFYPVSAFGNLNVTDEGNVTNATASVNVDAANESSWWNDIFILILVLIMVILVII